MRRISVSVVVVAVLGLAGVMLARWSSGAGEAPNASDSAERENAAVVGREGAGAAPAIDVEAARQAAVRVVATTGDVVDAGLISRRELVEELATPGFGPSLASDTSEQVDRILSGLASRGVDAADVDVVEVPVTAFGTPAEGGVRVSLWSVLVVNAPGAGVGRQAWRTVVVDMRLVDGRWLVDWWSSTPGPTPGLPPEGVLSAAEELRVPLRWEPVVAGAA